MMRNWLSLLFSGLALSLSAQSYSLTPEFILGAKSSDKIAEALYFTAFPKLDFPDHLSPKEVKAFQIETVEIPELKEWFQFDRAGRVVAKKQGGSLMRDSVAFHYDDSGRPSKIEKFLPGREGWRASEEITFRYEGNRILCKEVLEDGETHRAETTIREDSKNNLIEITQIKSERTDGAAALPTRCVILQAPFSESLLNQHKMDGFANFISFVDENGTLLHHTLYFPRELEKNETYSYSMTDSLKVVEQHIRESGFGETSETIYVRSYRPDGSLAGRKSLDGDRNVKTYTEIEYFPEHAVEKTFTPDAKIKRDQTDTYFPNGLFHSREEAMWFGGKRGTGFRLSYIYTFYP